MAYDLEAVNYQGDYAWFLKTALWAYSGAERLLENERFRLMPIAPHVSAAFPPSFISSGNGDPREPQAIALASRLHALGVPVDGLFFPGHTPALGHEYQFNLESDAGKEALQGMLAFMDSTLAGRERRPDQ